MDRYKKGLLVRSKAGHDTGKVYIIVESAEEYALACDGRIRTLANPKKKKFKHLQIINREYPIDTMDDVQIRRILKEYNREEI